MFVSRTIARRRIQAGIRPSWTAAWGLVALDAILLMILFWLTWPFARRISEGFGFPVWASGLTLFLVGFIPTQVVLILSSLWAVKSRWVGEDDRNPS